MASHGQHPLSAHKSFHPPGICMTSSHEFYSASGSVESPGNYSSITSNRDQARLSSAAQLGLELSLPARCWTVCASSRRERRATGRLLVLIISFPCSRRTRVSVLAGWPTWLREAMQMKSSVTMSTYVWVSPASWHCYFRYWPCRDWWPAPGLLRLGCWSTRFYSRW